jgi:hypothetical protein
MMKERQFLPPGGTILQNVPAGTFRMIADDFFSPAAVDGLAGWLMASNGYPSPAVLARK